MIRVAITLLTVFGVFILAGFGFLGYKIIQKKTSGEAAEANITSSQQIAIPLNAVQSLDLSKALQGKAYTITSITETPQGIVVHIENDLDQNNLIVLSGKNLEQTRIISVP